MLNKLERDRMDWVIDAIEQALNLDGGTLHDHSKIVSELRHAKSILLRMKDGEYSSKNY